MANFYRWESEFMSPKIFMRAAAVLFVAIWPTMVPAAGGSITGTIRTLHVNVQTNLAHLQLMGAPALDGGGCPSVFTANSLDDDKFMHYVWPLLVTAKARGLAIRLDVAGCLNGYAKIIAVDVEPRQ